MCTIFMSFQCILSQENLFTLRTFFCNSHDIAETFHQFLPAPLYCISTRLLGGFDFLESVEGEEHGREVEREYGRGITHVFKP